MRRRGVFVRDFRSGDAVEGFFVSAVASVLAIRFLLRLTGYFSLGGQQLHIAHVLWGGLLMMSSILILLLFLPEESKRTAAILGGIGFGTFIDEIGKFVTRDNDYFFRPTIALIYMVIVLAALAAREVQRAGRASEEEYLLNALRQLEGAAMHDLDPEEQRRALEYLHRADPEDPLVPVLHEALSRSLLVPKRPPGFASKARAWLRRQHRRLASQPWFDHAIIAFFGVRMALALAMVASILFVPGQDVGWIPPPFASLFARFANPSPADYAEAGTSLLAGFLGLIGIASLRRNRLEALRFFERSVLVTILLTQVFAFYRRQLFALTGLGFHIGLLVALRYMADRQRAFQNQANEVSAAPPAAAAGG